MLQIKLAQEAYRNKHGHKINQQGLAKLVIPETKVQGKLITPATKLNWLNGWNKGNLLEKVTPEIIHNIIQVTRIEYSDLFGLVYNNEPCCARNAVNLIALILKEEIKSDLVTAVIKVCSRHKVAPNFFFQDDELLTSCGCSTKKQSK